MGRGDNGYRVFTEDDFAWLDLIACLKATGMEIREIREFVRWNMEGDETIPVGWNCCALAARKPSGKWRSCKNAWISLTTRSPFMNRRWTSAKPGA